MWTWSLRDFLSQDFVGFGVGVLGAFSEQVLLEGFQGAYWLGQKFCRRLLFGAILQVGLRKEVPPRSTPAPSWEFRG